MPAADAPLRRLGFLTIGVFDPADPYPGHEATLEVIAYGEELGFDSAWLRQRHLQYGISSPVAVMAAASQRTSRIELGTAVIPLGLENPFRLAEDLATVDVLARGRITPGFSVGTPMGYDDLKLAAYPDTWEHENFDYERLLRLRSFLGGGAASDFAGTRGIEVYDTRVQPQSPGLAERLWYGGGSTRSAVWAGRNDFNLLTSSVVQGEGSVDFGAVQRSQILEFRANHPAGDRARVSQGLVVIPTDSATAGQRAKYEEYVASRSARVGVPQGPKGMLFAADIVGSSAEIAERLWADPAFQLVDEVAFALPFSFEPEDYRQILDDMAGVLGPLLGWTPKG